METCGQLWVTISVILLVNLAITAHGQEGSGVLLHNFNVSGSSVTLEFHLNNTEHIITGSKVYINFDSSVTSGSSTAGVSSDNVGIVIKLGIPPARQGPDVARITNGSSLIRLDPGVQHHALEIEGLFLGRTWIDLSYGVEGKGHSPELGNDTGHHSEEGIVLVKDEEFKVHLSVIRKDRAIDKIFIAMVALLVIIANVGMGCKVDLDVVKEVLKKPLAPAIGFFCQYLIMPLVSIIL